MVGLPARGKTFLSEKLARYLNWLGICCKVFNVGTYRRQISGAQQSNQFFNPANREAEGERMKAACLALQDMIQWLTTISIEGDAIAIYDATNSTVTRRKMLRESCKQFQIQTLFIESICEDDQIIMQSVCQVKMFSPDYVNMSKEDAIKDFYARINHYRSAYETLGREEEELEYSHVKLINLGNEIIINRIEDYRQSRIVFYLLNLHIKPRSVYISRHGETTHNQSGRIGGDADLSERGEEFAKELPNVLLQSIVGNLSIWTSTLKRTMQTAKHLPYPKTPLKALDELDAGICDGLTYEEISSRYPQDFHARDNDKYHYKYPGGESYADLVYRLEPIIMELERLENIMIIGHQAVLRAILAYFLNKSHEELPYLKIPLHVVLKITPKAYGCEVEQFNVNVPAVCTHRPKPL